MRVFAGILTLGQLAGALAAIGVACLGLWRYAIQPARKVAKVYASIGDNGHETVFQLLHGIKTDVNKLQQWRTTVDETLAHQNRTLEEQNAALSDQDEMLVKLLNRSGVT